MLEARNFAHLKNLSPFLGGIMDRCCLQSSDTTVASVFINYVGPIHDLFQRKRRPGGRSRSSYVLILA